MLIYGVDSEFTLPDIKESTKAFEVYHLPSRRDKPEIISKSVAMAYANNPPLQQVRIGVEEHITKLPILNLSERCYQCYIHKVSLTKESDTEKHTRH